MLSKEGRDLADQARKLFIELRRHERQHGAEVEQILSAIMSDVRSWRPDAFRLSLSIDTGPVGKVDL